MQPERPIRSEANDLAWSLAPLGIALVLCAAALWLMLGHGNATHAPLAPDADPEAPPRAEPTAEEPERAAAHPVSAAPRPDDARPAEE